MGLRQQQKKPYETDSPILRTFQSIWGYNSNPAWQTSRSFHSPPLGRSIPVSSPFSLRTSLETRPSRSFQSPCSAMDSPSASRSSLTQPSTSGRRSSSVRRIDLQSAVIVRDRNENDTAVLQLLKAAAERDFNRAKKWAKMLVRVGVDAAVAAVEDPDYKHHGPLHLAAAVGDAGICRMLIKTFKCNVNATDVDGGTPLIFALYGNGTLATVRILANNAADLNKGDNSGIAPLHITAERELCEVAELLLAKGAFVDPVCEDGETPLHIAARYGNAKMLKLLLKHNADFNRLSNKSTTPLVASLSCASLECLEILIKAGADVNACGSVNPLVEAARKGLTDCIKCLLEAGANANIADNEGNMPIEVAAFQGWTECVKNLFPVTDPLTKYAVWSIDGIIECERTERLRRGCRLTAAGDAAFLKADYVTAVASYTCAMELDLDSGLYAKRSLCYLRLNDEENALADAVTYKNMQPYLSDSSSDASTLVKDYGREWEMSCLNSGSGSGLIGDSI